MSSLSHAHWLERSLCVPESALPACVCVCAFEFICMPRSVCLPRVQGQSGVEVALYCPIAVGGTQPSRSKVKTLTVIAKCPADVSTLATECIHLVSKSMGSCNHAFKCEGFFFYFSKDFVYRVMFTVWELTVVHNCLLFTPLLLLKPHGPRFSETGSCDTIIQTYRRSS